MLSKSLRKAATVPCGCVFGCARVNSYAGPRYSLLFRSLEPHSQAIPCRVVSRLFEEHPASSQQSTSPPFARNNNDTSNNIVGWFRLQHQRTKHALARVGNEAYLQARMYSIVPTRTPLKHAPSYARKPLSEHKTRFTTIILQPRDGRCNASCVPRTGRRPSSNPRVS